jgi:hypothetical protein
MTTVLHVLHTKQMEFGDTYMLLEGCADDNHNTTATATTATDDIESVTDSDPYYHEFDVFQDEYSAPLYAIFGQYRRVFKHLQQFNGGYTLTLD